MGNIKDFNLTPFISINTWFGLFKSFSISYGLFSVETQCTCKCLLMTITIHIFNVLLKSFSFNHILLDVQMYQHSYAIALGVLINVQVQLTDHIRDCEPNTWVVIVGGERVTYSSRIQEQKAGLTWLQKKMPSRNNGQLRCTARTDLNRSMQIVDFLKKWFPLIHNTVKTITFLSQSNKRPKSHARQRVTEWAYCKYVRGRKKCILWGSVGYITGWL